MSNYVAQNNKKKRVALFFPALVTDMKDRGFDLINSRLHENAF